MADQKLNLSEITKYIVPKNLYTRLECTTSGSNKFYELYVIPVETNNLSHVVARYGKIDGNPAVAFKIKNTTIGAYYAGKYSGGKTKKGYKVVDKKSSDIMKSKKVAVKKAPTTRKKAKEVVPMGQPDRLSYIDFSD